MNNPTREQQISRLRRSCHFVPGANEKMLRKSLDTRADTLILDLEDAVTPDKKGEAREIVANWLGDVEFGRKERTVRINPLDTPWGLADLETTMQHPPDAYVIPKVSTSAELEQICSHLDALETRYGQAAGQTGLILIATETPRSALNVPALAGHERVVAVSWGAEDLSAALGAPRNRRPDGSYLPLYTHCRNITLLSAAAAGVAPIDTVYTDFRDPAGLRADCEEAAWLGYTGKITIHPDQIDTVNEYFSPSPTEVEQANRLIEAFEAAQAQGLMAISFEGSMVDVPHLVRAQKLVARDAAIRAQQS